MKKLLSGVLATSLLFSTFTLVTVNEPVSALVFQSETSGTCGQYASWYFHQETGTLTVYGWGAMENYPNYAPPWAHLRPEIKIVVVEPDITTIGWSAFHGCPNLTSVYLPNTLTHLEYGTFGYCTALSTIYLPPSLQVIGVAAFASCSALTSLSVPYATVSIEDSAFYGCSSLYSLQLPSSLRYVGSSAFRNCSSLSQVYYQGSSRSQIDIRSTYNSNLTSASWHNGNYTQAIPPIYPESLPRPELESEPELDLEPDPIVADWAEVYVSFVSGKIMPDISAYNYQEECTRGLIAESLFNQYGEEKTAESTPFMDVGEYEEAIGWSYENNLLSGFSDTYFGTESPLHREQFAVILKNTAELLEKTSLNGELDSLNQFEDGSSVSWWAEEGVAWAVANGLLSGDESGNLCPDTPISRVEVAVMLYQFEKL